MSLQIYTEPSKFENIVTMQDAFVTNLTALNGVFKEATKFDSSVTIYGDLSATGNSYFSNTIYSTTSALSVINIGTGTALFVGNIGTGDIASFYDLDQSVEVFHIGGHDAIHPNVGVKTSTPNKTFTVNGEISASGDIWTSGRIISDIIETGSGSITLFVSSGFVGINTELPNKSLTVVGDISATNDIWTSGRILSAGVDLSSIIYSAVTPKVTTSYNTLTLALSDGSSIKKLDTTSGDMYAIIPLNSSVPFNIGTQIVLANTSTNIATVSATSGVTLISKNDKFKLNFRGSVASLFKTETNEWILVGDLTA
jgi:hypothetical protein